MKNINTRIVGTIIYGYRRWLPIVIAASIYAFFAWRNRDFAIDDGMIYLRYISNFVHGYGLVYNPGVKFNGLTAPGYTLPLAFLAFVTHNPKLSVWLICTVTGFFGSMAWYGVFRTAFLQLKIPSTASAVYAYVSFLLSLTLPFFFLTYGMETTLFVFVSGLLVKAYLDERFFAVAFLAGWLACIRLEGGALLLGMLVHQLAFRRMLPPHIPRLLALFLTVPIFIFGFNFIYYGTLFSGTGMAKLWQGQTGLWGAHSFLHPPPFIYTFVFGDSKFTVIGLCVLALIGLVALWRSAVGVIIVIYLAVYTSVFVLLNIPNYHWYYYPYFSALPFLAVYGSAYLTAGARRAFRRGFGVLIALVAIAPLCTSAYYSVRYDTHPSPPDATYISIGKWIRIHTPPTSKIALPEIGFVGYYSDRYIIDTLGLVNRYNASEVHRMMFDGWLAHYRPDYILVHTPAWWPLEYGLYAAAARYGVSEVCDFNFPPYRLFKVGGEPGTGATCEGQRWLSIGSHPSPRITKIASGVAGQIGQVQVVGNVVRAQFHVDSQLPALAGFTIHSRDAYGMAAPERLPIEPTGNGELPTPIPTSWKLVAFFPNQAAAQKWGRAPKLFASDGHGDTYRLGPAVAQSESYSDAFFTGAANNQCSLDAIDGKPSADIASVSANSATSFGGWAGDGHGMAVGHGLLILRGARQTYTISFVTDVDRPDVVGALNSAGMAHSGFNLTATLTGVPPGIYSLLLASAAHTAPDVCSLNRTLTVKR